MDEDTRGKRQTDKGQMEGRTHTRQVDGHREMIGWI